MREGGSQEAREVPYGPKFCTAITSTVDSHIVLHELLREVPEPGLCNERKIEEKGVLCQIESSPNFRISQISFPFFGVHHMHLQ